jgi:serine/threonine-protein kinase
VRILRAIAEGIAAAHGRGVIHRDLKPQNIFLAKERVTVLDFGIAHVFSERGEPPKLTHTGAVLGTPRYMAPEQLLGEPVDARADVWALGAILLRALVGRTPIEARSLGEAMKVLRRGWALDVASWGAGLPQELVSLVRSTLVLRKGERLADVGAFIERLEQSSV